MIFNSVSVIVSSYQRHEEVVRAVKSGLSQKLPPMEVIVTNDGPDPEKADLLTALGDDRVRFLEAPRRGNASATRNFGIRQAKGDWVALLDDDDVWRPEKLAVQHAALERSGLEYAVLAGTEAVFSNGLQLHKRPARAVPANISADELLFSGYGGVNTSTLLAPRWAFEKHLFDESLERHEDWSWMLRVGAELPLVVAPEVVCERYLVPGQGLSRPGGFSFSHAWYEQNKTLMSPKPRADFVANILARKAGFDRKVTAFPWLVREVVRNGGMNVRNVAQLLRPWLVPARVRQALKAFRA